MYKQLDILHEVKRLKQHEHLSDREIARRLNIHRSTIPRLLERSVHLDQLTPKRSSPTNKSKGKLLLPKVIEILQTSMSNTNHKNRVTAAVIYDRFKNYDPPFFGYPPVSERTIARLVQLAKKELNMPDSYNDFSMEAEREKGVAQADFGEMDVIINHQTSRIYLFIMTFPYSNRKFACALPAQNFECLAEGMRHIFTAINGVPRVIRFDNMSTAVAQVKVDEDSPHAIKDVNGKVRKLTEGFAKMSTHYGYNFEFCNVRAGYEKGSVEQAVNWFRSRFFAITREFDKDYKRLNNELLQYSERAAKNHHYKFKDETVAERFEREKAALLPLPSTEFDGATWVARKADNYGRVQLDGNIFKIGAKRHSTVRIRRTWNTLEFFVDGELKEAAERPYEQSKDFISWTAELSGLIKKPTAFKSSILAKATPPEVVTFILRQVADDKRRIFTAMKDLLRDNKIEPVLKRLTQCVALYADAPLTEFICRFYAYGETRADDQPKISELESIAQSTDPVNLDQYDQLI